MSRLIALRIPDELAAKLDSRCSIRKVSATRALLDALERGWDEVPAMFGGDQPVGRTASGAAVGKAAPVASMDALRAICAGKLPPVQEPLQDTDYNNDYPVRCPYTEYDSQTGETYQCCLVVHSAKYKHKRGDAIK